MFELQDIQTKIRRITDSLSENVLSTEEIDNYINTFILNDFPAEIKLNTFKTVLRFYTRPYIDRYETTTTNEDDPLFDFKNKYVSVEPPVYIAGREATYLQSRDQFYGLFPQQSFIKVIGQGNNNQTVYQGTLDNAPVLQNNVLFTAETINNNALIVRDNPLSASQGDLLDQNNQNVGNINYITGDYNLTFPSPPLQGTDVYAQTFGYKPSIPTTVLYYQNEFRVRPVPDKSYPIDIEAYIKPTMLLELDQTPELNEYFEYIAYGASLKIFEDRQSSESMEFYVPIFKRYERLVLRKTIQQNSSQRVATIYDEQDYRNGSFNRYFSGGF